MVISKKLKIKKPIRRVPVRAKAAKLKVQSKTASKSIGSIVHYFTNIGVAVVNLKNPLHRGDYIKVLGNTTNFKQKASSIQFNRRPISLATRGKEVGLKVNYRVRKGDQVFKFV